MKKLLSILFLLIALSFTAEAQVHPPYPKHPRYRHRPPRTEVQPRQNRDPKYIYSPRGEFRFHVIGDLGARDFGAIFRHGFPYHFSVGGMAEYQVGHITSIGVGAEFYSSYGERCRLFEYMEQTYIHTLPIYANLKLTLPHAPVSPFIEGRIGYSAPLNTVTCNDPNGIHHYKSTGLYTGGAVGIKIFRVYLSAGISAIDVVDSDLGLNGRRKDVITDFYVRCSFAF